jgi:catechol 2,3-dioxygenase-like lactoylglutathione lyase family enzyme
MLRNGRVAASLPAQDLERARAFYAEKLGLEPAEEREGGLCYVCANGEFALFESIGSAAGDHTQMGWEVDDIEATQRGDWGPSDARRPPATPTPWSQAGEAPGAGVRRLRPSLLRLRALRRAAGGPPRQRRPD